MDHHDLHRGRGPPYRSHQVLASGGGRGLSTQVDAVPAVDNVLVVPQLHFATPTQDLPLNRPGLSPERSEMAAIGGILVKTLSQIFSAKGPSCLS
jgi:hypothetical protein